MTNLRDEISIPDGIWTLIINGKTNARVSQKLVLTEGYMTIAYDDSISDPNALAVPIQIISDTVEKMEFIKGEWIFKNTVAGYVWAAPYGSNPGNLVIT